MNTKVRPTYHAAGYDLGSMEFSSYRNNLTEPASQVETEASYEIERHLLHVSSQYRDRAAYPDPGFFKVEIPGGYRDVVAVELVAGTLPNQPGLVTNPYLLLDMGQMNQVRSLNGNTYFAVVNFFNHISNTTFLTLDRSQTEGKPSLFKPPKQSLNDLTIRFLYPDGTQVTFGDEPVGQLMNYQKQVSLVFNIHTRVRRRIGIDRDSRSIPRMV